MTTEFAKPLVLASPPEKGTRPKDARYLLAGNNAFDTDFNPGPSPAAMNPQILAATKRALWLLGYPTPIGHAFTQDLYDHLSGKTALPKAYKTRRTTRLAHQASVKQKGLAAALRDAKARVHESPAGSNHNPYGEWYEMDGVPWCCIAITYWLVVDGGSKDWQRGSFASYVGSVVDAARAGERHLSITTAPEPGDLATYAGDEHIEFFNGWETSGHSFHSVGGNTSSSDGSPSNGGIVAENLRYVTGGFPVTAFVRVGD